jgi:hypothetical protein
LPQGIFISTKHVREPKFCRETDNGTYISLAEVIDDCRIVEDRQPPSPFWSNSHDNHYSQATVKLKLRVQSRDSHVVAVIASFQCGATRLFNMDLATGIKRWKGIKSESMRYQCMEGKKTSSQTAKRFYRSSLCRTPLFHREYEIRCGAIKVSPQCIGGRRGSGAVFTLFLV